MTTYAELEERTDRLALALLDSGAGPGGPVGVLCRNARAPIEAMVAAGKVGADVVLVNTGLSAEQLRGVQEQQKLHTLVADPDFLDVVPPGPRVVLTSTPDGPRPAGDRVLDDLDAMVERGGPGELPFAGAVQADRADLRHHRDAEGRQAAAPVDPRPGGVDPLGDPAARG